MDMADSKKPGVSGRFVVSELAEMGQLLGILGQDRRAAAFQKAGRGIIAAEIVKIVDGGDTVLAQNLKKIRGVGDGIAQVIMEIIAGGECAELQKMRSDPKIMATKLFSSVLGVGPVAAAEWAESMKTIPEVRRAVAEGKIKLTQIQKCGLGFHEDLQKRVPRDDVAEISAILGEVAKASGGKKWETAGSYRRLQESSGDIDFLVCGGREVLAKMMKKMEENENFLCKIVAGDERASFVFRHRGVARQVDILVISAESYWAAVVYFTGSYEFNEAMRGVAKSRGYRLNQRGLYSGEKLVATTSEKDVFKKVGIKWVEPADRKSYSDVVLLGK